VENHIHPREVGGGGFLFPARKAIWISVLRLHFSSSDPEPHVGRRQKSAR